jgi:hypothetical protein
MDGPLVETLMTFFRHLNFQCGLLKIIARRGTGYYGVRNISDKIDATLGYLVYGYSSMAEQRAYTLKCLLSFNPCAW